MSAGFQVRKAAGGRDDDTDELVAIARGERLEQRIVLRIRRQDAGARFRRALHEEITSADETFLVGERDMRAAIDRRQRRLQSGGATHGGHHPIGRTRAGLDHRAFAGAAFGAGARERSLEFGKLGDVGDRDEARGELLRELCQRLDIAVCRQRLDTVALGRGAQQIHRAVADRAGGAENRDAADARCRSLVVTQWDRAHMFTKP